MMRDSAQSESFFMPMTGNVAGSGYSLCRNLHLVSIRFVMKNRQPEIKFGLEKFMRISFKLKSNVPKFVAKFAANGVNTWVSRDNLSLGDIFSGFGGRFHQCSPMR